MYYQKKESLKINYESLQRLSLEKEQEINPNKVRKKAMIKIVVEINKMGSKHTIEKHKV